MITMEAGQEPTVLEKGLVPERSLRSAADLAVPMEAVTPANTNRDVIHFFTTSRSTRSCVRWPKR